MFDQLIARPAASATATTKQAPKARTTRAATPKAKQATKAVPAATAIKFAVQDFARPKAGNMLAAHTAAFLGMSGMLDGAAFPKAQATKVLGARAVQYHTNNGNFAQTSAGLTLTDKGMEFFATRSLVADAEGIAAYETFFAKGGTNPAINVKTEGSIVKL